MSQSSKTPTPPDSRQSPTSSPEDLAYALGKMTATLHAVLEASEKTQRVAEGTDRDVKRLVAEFKRDLEKRIDSLEEGLETRIQKLELWRAYLAGGYAVLIIIVAAVEIIRTIG